MSEAVVKKYLEEEIILRQGDNDRSLYKVMSGKVVLYVNYGEEDEYLVGVISFPKCFNEMGVLIGEPSSYTAVSLTETTILHVPEDNFEVFIQNDYKNAMSIMKTMAKNLSLANMNIKMLVEELAHLNEPADLSEEDREKRKYIRKKEYSCPHCGNEFKDITIKRETEEEEPIEFQYIQPEWYEIITCPKCYFSVMDKYFAKNLKIDKSVYEAGLTKLREKKQLLFTDNRTLEHVLDRYYLALECASGLYKSLQMRVHILDNLCRLYEKNGDFDQLQFVRKMEIEECKKIYLNVQLNDKQEQKLCMKIAELFYNLKDLEGTREWIKVSYKNGVKDDEYVELARKMMHDLKEELEGNA